MTSLFDFSHSVGNAMADTPIDLIAAGGRGVSVLEFFVLEDAERERLAREEAEVQARQPIESAPIERARQVQVMIEAAKSDAYEQAKGDFDVQLQSKLIEERLRVETVSSEFAMDRQRYFAAAEGQVVKLALAIARRILTREVQADVMHLTATVRAALARVHDGSASVLRVNSGEQTLWQPLFSSASEVAVSVVGDEHVDAGECILETTVGRVELGVKVQLSEIERGFGDLLRRQGE